MLLLSFIGYKIDEARNPGKFWYTLGGIFLALSWSFYDMFKRIKALDKKEKD